MFLALERVLAEQGGLVAAAFSSYAGFDHLHDEPFDAVVLNGAQDAQTAISLCAALRRNATQPAVGLNPSRAMWRNTALPRRAMPRG